MAQLRRRSEDLRVVFAGPTIYGLDIDWSGVELRRPAQQGDVERAVADGACAIGLVDGHYQQVGAVWHKEILHALSCGVLMFGSSSMGALRAAECQAFGMIPVGGIARRYCNGELFDDAEVAVTNGPEELGFPPLTEPMVTVIATLGELLAVGIVDAGEASVLESSARSLFFADRTVEAIFENLRLGPRTSEVRTAYLQNRVDLKAIDAHILVQAVREAKRPAFAAKTWKVANSPFWTARAVRSDHVTRP